MCYICCILPISESPTSNLRISLTWRISAHQPGTIHTIIHTFTTLNSCCIICNLYCKGLNTSMCQSARIASGCISIPSPSTGGGRAAEVFCVNDSSSVLCINQWISYFQQTKGRMNLRLYENMKQWICTCKYAGEVQAVVRPGKHTM